MLSPIQEKRGFTRTCLSLRLPGPAPRRPGQGGDSGARGLCEAPPRHAAVLWGFPGRVPARTAERSAPPSTPRLLGANPSGRGRGARGGVRRPHRVGDSAPSSGPATRPGSRSPTASPGRDLPRRTERPVSSPMCPHLPPGAQTRPAAQSRTHGVAQAHPRPPRPGQGPHPPLLRRRTSWFLGPDLPEALPAPTLPLPEGSPAGRSVPVRTWKPLRVLSGHGEITGSSDKDDSPETEDETR